MPNEIKGKDWRNWITPEIRKKIADFEDVMCILGCREQLHAQHQTAATGEALRKSVTRSRTVKTKLLNEIAKAIHAAWQDS